MKILLLGISLLISLSSMAGTLTNRTTSESIDFYLDVDRSFVQVVSRASGLKNKTLDLSNLKRKKDQIGYFHLSRWIIEGTGGLVYLPPVIVFALAVNVTDLLAIPFIASADAIRNQKYKKDFNLLMRAIMTDSVIEMSSKKFNRIKNNLANMN